MKAPAAVKFGTKAVCELGWSRIYTLFQPHLQQEHPAPNVASPMRSVLPLPGAIGREPRPERQNFAPHYLPPNPWRAWHHQPGQGVQGYGLVYRAPTSTERRLIRRVPAPSLRLCGDALLFGA
ncbi:hypothetical protein [Methylobacterium sp. Leaf100]|uniref:hypothetical protein n=1 Tax=Methylobacterium sp. Leaf100 TaxID=1736252 RepID=UPI0012E0E3F1|nr:hypothetical protein [Methylobacterium sp. Leaf100]